MSKSKLFLTAALGVVATSLMTATTVHAQQNNENDDVDVIIVEGQIGALANSVAAQRNDDGIVTVLSSDDIGALPDENVAEAARRALGVSIANDQGEGRFISIRGINSQLNSTSVNGVRLTSPEATDRRVAMDVIDADVLESITIRKTLSADMDGDAIGGSIELKTISGLNRKKALKKIKIGGIYSELSDKYGPKISGTYVDSIMEGRLGVALNGSFQNREFASDNKEVDGGWETKDFVGPAEELELRNYDVTRERLSLSGNFDYALTDQTTIYLNTLYNNFSDHEFRSRTEIKVEDAVDDGTVVNSGNLVTYSGEDIEIDRDIKDRLEEQEIYSLSGGFRHASETWDADASISFTHAEEAEPDRLNANFDTDISEAVSLNVSNPLLPTLALSDSARATYLDPSAYELDKVEVEDGLTQDDEWALAFNAKRYFDMNGNESFIKFGAKYRLREKSYEYDFREYSYEGDGTGATLLELGTRVNYPIDLFGPAPDAARIRAFFAANRNNSSIFKLEEADSAAESIPANFNANEDVLAGYVMGQTNVNGWTLTTGLRVEKTDFSANANQYDIEAETTTPIRVEKEYTDVLPSVFAKYAYSDNVNIRGSYYASIIRPNFAQVIPSVIIEDRDLSDANDPEYGVFESGNPNLERTKANNFDLLVEYFPTKTSVIQGGFFYKDLENLITETELKDGTLNGLRYDELATFVNVDNGEIFGIELGAHHAFENGIVLGANYTYADSEATLDGETFPIPGQSEHIANAIIGYDKGRLDLRAALSYKSENLDDVDTDLIGEGRWVQDQTFLDLSAKYDIDDRFKVYVDMKNVLDTPLEVTDRVDGVNYLNQYDDYGYQVQFGLIGRF